MALLIFDLDDTLYSSEVYTHARQQAIDRVIAKKCGVDISIAPKLLKDKLAEYKRLGKPPSSTRALEEIGVTKAEFMQALDDPDPSICIPFSERTLSAIKSLAKEHTLIVYTNSPESSTRRILDALRIRDLFAAIYHSGNFPQSKPYQPAIEKILTTHKERPIVAIGDSIEKDLLPLRMHGAKLVWVNMFEEVHPQVDVVVRDMGDLLSLKFL